LERTQREGIPTLLDAGSVHEGTLALMNKWIIWFVPKKFARQIAGDEETALARLAEVSACCRHYTGRKGLIWRRGQERGVLSAFPVNAIDTTGAGDAFHGAFAAAIALRMNWPDVLWYASAAGSLCCTKRVHAQDCLRGKNTEHCSSSEKTAIYKPEFPVQTSGRSIAGYIEACIDLVVTPRLAQSKPIILRQSL